MKLLGSLRTSDLTAALAKLFKADLMLGITEDQWKNGLNNRGKAYLKLFKKQLTKGLTNFTKNFGIKLYCSADWKSIIEYESNDSLGYD